MIRPKIPAGDMPVIEATVQKLRVAVRQIEAERPRTYENLLGSAGLLAAGAAKLMVDEIGSNPGGWIEYGALGRALAATAHDRPEFGRESLMKALAALVELAVLQTPEADREQTLSVMIDWMVEVLDAFDGEEE